MNDLLTGYFTYLKNRKCFHCGEPIADQEHATTKFCPREVLSDGTIKSCKDDYHAALRKLKDCPFKKIANYHKGAYQRLASLFREAEDGIITLDQLKLYRINLSRPVEFKVDRNQVATYFFVEFAIIQSPNNQFKIYTHGRDI